MGYSPWGHKESFCHLLILFIISFAVQRHLSLIGSHLFISVFISTTPEMSQRGSCCDLFQSVHWPMFCSKSFIVSGFTFKSIIHFEFIFVYDVRRCSSFILLNVRFSSVAQSCPALCDPMNHSTPGLLSITNSWSLLKLMSMSQ